jgi:hypothetical protein
MIKFLEPAKKPLIVGEQFEITPIFGGSDLQSICGVKCWYPHIHFKIRNLKELNILNVP